MLSETVQNRQRKNFQVLRELYVLNEMLTFEITGERAKNILEMTSCFKIFKYLAILFNVECNFCAKRKTVAISFLIFIEYSFYIKIKTNSLT